MTAPPPHGAGHASQCSNTRIAATHTRPWSNIRDRIGRLCARVRGLVVTVKPLQRHISDSPHRSGDCPTTAWCGERLTVLKNPHCGHSHASVTSDVGMKCTKVNGTRVRRNGFTVTEVDFNVRSSTIRLISHGMAPHEVCGGQEQSRSTCLAFSGSFWCAPQLDQQDSRFWCE